VSDNVEQCSETDICLYIYIYIYVCVCVCVCVCACVHTDSCQTIVIGLEKS